MVSMRWAAKGAQALIDVGSARSSVILQSWLTQELTAAGPESLHVIYSLSHKAKKSEQPLR
jgi:hypothetical protein